MSKELKYLLPITGTMLGSLAIGASLMLALVSQGSVSSLICFAAVLTIVALGFAWWWYSMIADEAIQANWQPEVREPTRYMMPEDIQEILDEGAHCVTQMADAASKALNVEMKLRQQMSSLAEYITKVEDEREMLRVEAEKVREIQAVAARTPRLTVPKTNPDEYGVRKQSQPQLPDQLPEPLAFLRRAEPVNLSEIESALASAPAG